MDYIKHYTRIIENRRVNPLPKNVYVEKHHIVPKAEGGSNKKDNLVRLTAREHYVCHLLLAKIYGDFEMYLAVQRMQSKSKTHKREFRFNSRLFEAMKKNCQKLNSEWHIGKCSGMNNPMYGVHLFGEKNPMYGRRGDKSPWFGKKHTPEELKKMSDSSKNKKKVVAYKDGNLFGEYESITEASTVLSADKSTICKVLRGKRSQTIGFTFQYAE